MKRLLLVVIVLLWAAGCSPDIEGQWDGSGEFFQGRPFSVQFVVHDDHTVTGIFTDQQTSGKGIVICDLHYNDDTGEVSFAFNTYADQDKQACTDLQNVYMFKGSMGYGVIAGEIQDVNGKQAGQFRALKKFE